LRANVEEQHSYRFNNFEKIDPYGIKKIENEDDP
jgi:hypothetical protein